MRPRAYSTTGRGTQIWLWATDRMETDRFGDTVIRIDRRRSQRGNQLGIFVLVCCGRNMLEKQKQSVFAQSTVEAEFIALFEAMREALWIEKFPEPDGIPESVLNVSIGEDSKL